ncbi:methionine abc transporter atp-binding protein [hydrocarbon metagenome]|uniref:Methionine abc transporter atp-binding protein n=1 Tax=hydrocarbon metagenome TaxID=938273 RepID=A0A0W8EYG3_9ZZZZ
MIEATSLSKTFRAGSSEVRAVEDAHLAVQAGEFILILGRSGSGKSTLLGMLAGLIKPTTGTVRVHNVDLGSLSDESISELRARRIGFVFQFSGLLPTVTVLENVMLPTLFSPDRSDVRSRALSLLEKVGLSERADAYPRTLSSGEMKRAAIARALINRPALLIADEPTGDLDVDTEYEIMEIFSTLNREGMTMVMVTHNPDLIPYATRTFGMDHGRLVEGGFSSIHSGHGPGTGGTRGKG